MKGLKKAAAVFAAALAAGLAAAFCLTACRKNPQGTAKLVSAEGNTIVIEGLRTDTSVSLADVLYSFKEEGKLTFEAQDGDYGWQIMSVNGYVPDAAKNEFWAIYTTLEEYGGDLYSDTSWGTFVYDGKTLGSAAYGASGMPVIEGELYILTLSTY